jgi:3-hydroxymyristoyl/3-hydroxydecanoyl-(acyl carrier protein) dehydratase
MLAPCTKTSFSDTDMQNLSWAGHKPGTWASVLGASANGVLHKLCARKMLMIDRVTHLMPRGGAHGLGLLIGEKSLERDHWYFPCHFKDDEVMAGSLVSDGCSQLLKLYMIWLGLHKAIEGVTFRPVNGQPNKVPATTPTPTRIVYHLHSAHLCGSPLRLSSTREPALHVLLRRRCAAAARSPRTRASWSTGWRLPRLASTRRLAIRSAGPT